MKLKWEFIVSSVFCLNLLAFSSDKKRQPKCRELLNFHPSLQHRSLNETYEKIIDWIVENKKIPAGFKEWSRVGVNYGKFAGIGDYTKGGESYRSRLHNNPKEAFSKLLEKIMSTNKLDVLLEKDKATILLDLKIRAGNKKAYSEKMNALREESYEKIIQYILLNKKIPAGNREWTNLGVNYGKFAGIGDYFPGGESYGSRLHNNPQEAFTKLLEKFENPELPSSLTEKEKNDILLELKIRSGQPNAFNQKIDFLRQQAFEKILKSTIEHKKIPAGFQEWNTLGVNYGKFVGSSDYAEGGESHASRFHDSPPEAFQGLYYFAEGSPLLENQAELKSEILQIIAKRYQDALKRDKRRREKTQAPE
jgi:hypothetical protein